MLVAQGTADCLFTSTAVDYLWYCVTIWAAVSTSDWCIFFYIAFYLIVYF